MRSARHGAAESITTHRVLVRTVTGLERLAAAEIELAGHRVVELSKRQLVVRPRSARILTEPPRLADDLFLIGATDADPGPTKTALAAWAQTIRLTAPLRHRPGESFAVSASFLGRRRYSRFDLEDLVGAVIADRTGAVYHSRRTGTTPPEPRIDWRVVLDGTTAHLAVRPFEAPLHRRGWRRRTVIGSLHPPIAAAIARLARLQAGHQVLDPFCGAGTLLLEARQVEPAAAYTGIDRDPAAIAAARANTIRGTVDWNVGDAGRLERPVDRIVTNPPWDVRLGIGDLTAYLDSWRRVLRPGGLAVAILNPDQTETLVRDPAWRTVAVHELSVAGQHPRIVVARPVRT